MSPWDPRLMKTAPPPAATVIDDHLCPGCGYNLRGLPGGSRCPECGRKNERVERIDDPLSRMPLNVIRRLRFGCWMASAWVVAAMFLVMQSARLGLGATGFAAVDAAAAIGWQITVIFLTPSFTLPQAVWHGFGPNSRMRRAARWLQLGWVVAATIMLVRTLLPATWGGPWWLLSWSAGLAALVGMAGIVVLGVLLTDLSEWTRDDLAARTFNFAAWMIPLATLLLVVNPANPIIHVLVALIWVAAMSAYPVALISLARSVELSVHHAREYQGRLRRRDERQKQYDDEVSRTVERMDAARRQRGHEP